MIKSNAIMIQGEVSLADCCLLAGEIYDNDQLIGYRLLLDRGGSKKMITVVNAQAATYVAKLQASYPDADAQSPGEPFIVENPLPDWKTVCKQLERTDNQTLAPYFTEIDKFYLKLLGLE